MPTLSLAGRGRPSSICMPPSPKCRHQTRAFACASEALCAFVRVLLRLRPVYHFLYQFCRSQKWDPESVAVRRLCRNPSWWQHMVRHLARLRVTSRFQTTRFGSRAHDITSARWIRITSRRISHAPPPFPMRPRSSRPPLHTGLMLIPESAAHRSNPRSRTVQYDADRLHRACCRPRGQPGPRLRQVPGRAPERFALRQGSRPHG